MRSRRLFGLAATLKRVAHARGVAVIVTNQVSDVWEESAVAGVSGLSGGSGGGGDASWATMPYAWGAPCIGRTSVPAHPGSCCLRSNGRACQPALGAAWAQCVGSRILLAYDRGSVPAPAAPAFAALVHAPPLPPGPAVSLPALSADSSGGGSGISSRVPAAGGVRSAWLLRSPCAPRRAVQFELWPGGARGVGALLDLPVG